MSMKVLYLVAFFLTCRLLAQALVALRSLLSERNKWFSGDLLIWLLTV